MGLWMTKYFKAFPTTYKVGLLSQCMIVYHQVMLVISILPPYHPNMVRRIKNIILLVNHNLVCGWPFHGFVVDHFMGLWSPISWVCGRPFHGFVVDHFMGLRLTKYFNFTTTYNVGLLSQCMIVYHQVMWWDDFASQIVWVRLLENHRQHIISLTDNS